MAETYQYKNISVLKHGEMVHQEYINIIENYQRYEKINFLLLKNLRQIHEKTLPLDRMKEYHLYHDCGKPFVLTKDDQGQHFDNHADKSAEIYFKYINQDKDIYWLIKNDMFLHTKSSEKIKEILDHPLILSLMLSSLAELYANKDMFGGLHSESFKIKYKKLDRRINQILSYKGFI